MNVAIVKPDHFGDLILSSAAIRAALTKFPDATLILCKQNRPLANMLFGVNRRVIAFDFEHLQGGTNKRADFPDLRPFDLVIFLRHDQVLNEQFALIACRDFIFPVNSNEHHQSVIDYSVVSSIVGPYDIDSCHFGEEAESIRRKTASVPNHIGLCIGSGFYAKKWPLSSWVSLGRQLASSGKQLSIVCGQREYAEAVVVARALNLSVRDKIIAGSSDLTATSTRLRELDWVVASDGGTAHLCSLFAPILSIFGPSPFKRYAPFGIWNRLITQELSCSPCLGWSARAVNGCICAECMSGIRASQVMSALEPHFLKESDPGRSYLGQGCWLYRGASHLERDEELDER